MSTNKSELSASTILNNEMEKLGEAFGGSTQAQIKSIKAFAKHANSKDKPNDLDAAAKEAATAFGRGAARKSNEPVTDGSIDQYAKAMKLFADSKVFAVIDQIETVATKFCADVPYKERAEKKLFPLMKQAASAVRKGKASEITPGLFAGFCVAKAEPSKEDKEKTAKSALREAILALHKAGLLTMSMKSDLLEIAGELKVEVKFPDETPAAVVPATPDLNAIIAAAVANALAAVGK